MLFDAKRWRHAKERTRKEWHRALCIYCGDYIQFIHLNWTEELHVWDFCRLLMALFLSRSHVSARAFQLAENGTSAGYTTTWFRKAFLPFIIREYLESVARTSEKVFVEVLPRSTKKLQKKHTGNRFSVNSVKNAQTDVWKPERGHVKKEALKNTQKYPAQGTSPTSQFL